MNCVRRNLILCYKTLNSVLINIIKLKNHPKLKDTKTTIVVMKTSSVDNTKWIKNSGLILSLNLHIFLIQKLFLF